MMRYSNLAEAKQNVIQLQKYLGKSHKTNLDRKVLKFLVVRYDANEFENFHKLYTENNYIGSFIRAGF